MGKRTLSTMFAVFIGWVSVTWADNEKPTTVRVAQNEIATPPAPEDIELWINHLNAPEFEKREDATQRLIAAGAVAAQPLLKAAPTASLEASVRIATILRQWYTSDEDALWEAAEAGLEALSQSKNRHLARRSTETLNQFAFTLRQERALVEIKKLGGSIKDLNNRGFPGGAAPEDARSFMIVLGREWKGGNDGLKFVRRISGMTALYLMGDKATDKILTPGITAEGLADLRREMPQLMIAFRGPAFLGISPSSRVPGCRIETVSPGSPADKAKLMSGDVIAKFDGRPVADFEELVEFIKDKQPGDKIKLHVLRGDDEDLFFLERLQAIKEPNPAKEQLEKLLKRLTIEVEVTLAEWGAK